MLQVSTVLYAFSKGTRAHPCVCKPVTVTHILKALPVAWLEVTGFHLRQPRSENALSLFMLLSTGGWLMQVQSARQCSAMVIRL